ncbi:MAG: hypothetical protein IJM36_00935 [Acholeplasmatales bacterium]|nr:hypothetical protein [Acholeplasmatales bacterium]
MNYGISMDINNLLKEFNITAYQKECFNYYIKLRGIIDHYQIKELLESHKVIPRYETISSTFRYDKRIRRILFKYITIIEEYFRSHIINNEYQVDRYDSNYITTILFSKLVKHNKIKSFLSNKKTFNYHSTKNLKALVTLRNKVMHSNLLITNKNLEECRINQKKSSCLIDNIINMMFYLPTNEIALSFIREINIASKKEIKKHQMQLEWDLPSFLVISIDESILKSFHNKI